MCVDSALGHTLAGVHITNQRTEAPTHRVCPTAGSPAWQEQWSVIQNSRNPEQTERDL